MTGENKMQGHIESYEQRQARERAEAQERRDRLHAFAIEIANALGDGLWTVVLDSNEPHLEKYPHIRRDSDGAEFYISHAYREKNRLQVGAEWPKDATGKPNAPYFSQYSPNGAAPPSITFADSKSAQQAARDIERRFLPAYLPLWERQAAQVVSANTYRSNMAELAQRIAGILHATVAPSRTPYDGSQPNVRLGHRERGITDVQFGDDEQRIRITVTCTIQELETIAEMFPLGQNDIK
jgi:hypothetical protein